MRGRPSEEVYNRMVEQSQRQGETIGKVRVVVDKFDGEFWPAIVERLQARIEAGQALRANNFVQMTEVQLKCAIAEEETLKRVISMPDEFKRDLATYEKEHESLNKRIREYRDRLKG